MGLIYCFTNQINHKKYIGQTINNNNVRYNQHKSSYQNSNDSEYNSILHRAFRKYGFDNFIYEVLIDNINDVNLLNQLEVYYIKFYNTQVPNGYNIEPGGKNANKPKTDKQKYKLTWSQAKFSEEEIIKLREAYANHESPKQIYDLLYKDRLEYSSFLNIWSGRRYKNVKPELLNKGRHTKMNQQLADEIRRRYNEEHISYEKLSLLYHCSKATIADIIKNRTWKNPKK